MSHYSSIPFDYNETINDKQIIWHRKPCTLCGMNNHVVSKCWKIMDLYMKVMETRKNPWHEELCPCQEKNKGMTTWIHKNCCAHCNKGRHQESTCWTLHSELHPKKDKKSNEVTHKGSELQEEDKLPKNKQLTKEDIFILMARRMNKTLS